MLKLLGSRSKNNHCSEVNPNEYKKYMLATEANKRITLADDVLVFI